VLHILQHEIAACALETDSFVLSVCDCQVRFPFKALAINGQSEEHLQKVDILLLLFCLFMIFRNYFFALGTQFPRDLEINERKNI
jgi:hypothetical protein